MMVERGDEQGTAQNDGDEQGTAQNDGDKQCDPHCDDQDGVCCCFAQPKQFEVLQIVYAQW